MMHFLPTTLEGWANVATIVGAGGLIVAYLQLRAGLQGQREATALGIWKDYLALALQHPHLAAPQPYLTGVGRDSETFARYEWFVSMMLFACEQIVALQPRDREWRSTVQDQLRLHREYLRGTEFSANCYSKQLRALIKMVVADKSVASVV